jgi:cytochrome oxidase Cu insertion factor (SCO1/SenC/PrrC family)
LEGDADSYPACDLGTVAVVRNVEVIALRQRTVSSYGTVPSFQLVNQNGQAFGSAQIAGKIWIADFIYTTCPGPCPMISSRMSELQKPLEKTDVHLVSFSVDPEKDTTEVLRGYAEKLQAEPVRWDFLTDPNLRSINFRTTASNLPYPTAAMLREFRCTARGWC